MKCTNADNELKHCSLKSCPYFSDNLMMYNFEKNNCPYNLPLPIKPCVICQENKPTDYDGYCQSCHHEIAERNVRDGTK